jgi:hypothetical protein
MGSVLAYQFRLRNGITVATAATVSTRGAAPVPGYFFALTQKSIQKKSRLTSFLKQNYGSGKATRHNSSFQSSNSAAYPTRPFSLPLFCNQKTCRPVVHMNKAGSVLTAGALKLLYVQPWGDWCIWGLPPPLPWMSPENELLFFEEN